MNAFQVIFLACLLLSCGYALLKGEGPERLAAVAMLAAAFASPLVERAGFADPEYGLLAVDLALLVCLVALALATARFWPMWAAAFHLTGAAMHLAKVADPTVWPMAYAVGSIWWSYPVLGALAYGTWREARRLAEDGPRSWRRASDTVPEPHPGPAPPRS